MPRNIRQTYKISYCVIITYDENTNSFLRYKKELINQTYTEKLGRIDQSSNNECRVYVKSLLDVNEDEMKKLILKSYKYSTMILEKIKQEEETKLNNTIQQIEHKKAIIKKLSYLEREKKLKRII